MKNLVFPRAAYLAFLLYEVLKAALLSAKALSAGVLPAGGGVFEHSAAAALCLVPAMYFMLAVNERAFSFCLPLVAIAKGLSLLSLAFLGGRIAKALFSPSQALQDAAFAVGAATACASGDLISAIFCLRRQKKICG